MQLSIDDNDFVSGWSFPRNVSKYSQVRLAHNELIKKEIISGENLGESLAELSGETSANTKTVSPLCFCNLLCPGQSSKMVGAGKCQ